MWEDRSESQRGLLGLLKSFGGLVERVARECKRLGCRMRRCGRDLKGVRRMRVWRETGRGGRGW